MNAKKSTASSVFDATDDIPEPIVDDSPSVEEMERKPLKPIRYSELPAPDKVKDGDVAKWLRKEGYAAPVRKWRVVGIKKDHPKKPLEFDAVDEGEAVRLYVLARSPEVNEKNRHTWQFRAEQAEE